MIMIERIKLLNDQPIGGNENERNDGLGFSTYSDIIASTIKGTPGPFTIGIFGEWGTGKTSLLKLIKDKFYNDYNVLPVWFNAWMYEKEEHPLLPLISTIIKEIKANNNFWDKIEDKRTLFLNALRAVAYGFSSKSKLKIPGFAEIEASFVAKNMIDRESDLSFDPLLDKAIYYNSFEQLSAIRISGSKKIVIFIDDLDRCFPDKAIKLLESIKLVLFQKGFIFVLGVARQVIEGYLRYRYKAEYGLEEFEGQKYLDKIVQLSFPIPPHKQRIEDFSSVLLNQLEDKDKKALRPVLPIIGAACAYNPRSTVRFINNLLIDLAISEILFSGQNPEDMAVGYFAITRGLQQRWINLYSQLISSNELCQKISKLEKDNLDIENLNENDSSSSLIQDIYIDNDLQKLIFSEEGRNWLQNKESRNFAIDFLRTQRQLSNEEGISLSGATKRVFELARELNLPTKELLIKIKDMPDIVGIMSHMSTLNETQVAIIKDKFREM
jgi:hypothetical protein